MEMIEGVVITPLKINLDQRGKLIELVRLDELDVQESLGEIRQVYMTTVNPGVVKAFHMHREQVDCFVCIKGNILLGLYDSREGSATYGKTMKIFMGEEKMLRVVIPNKVDHGFKGISDSPSIIINCINMEYNPNNPDEFRKPYNEYGEDVWALRNY